MKKLEITLATHRLQEIEPAFRSYPIECLSVATVQWASAPSGPRAEHAREEHGLAPRIKIDILTDDHCCAEIVELLAGMGPPAESADLLVTDVFDLTPIGAYESAGAA
jgi:hypothetical protein